MPEHEQDDNGPHELLRDRFADNPAMVGQLDRVSIVQQKLHEIDIAEKTAEDQRRTTVLHLLDRLLLALATGDPLLFGEAFVSNLTAQIDAIDSNVSTYNCSASGDPVPGLAEFTRNAFVPDATAAASVLGGIAENAVAVAAEATAALALASELVAQLDRDRTAASGTLDELTSSATETLAEEQRARSEELEALQKRVADALEADRVEFAKACESRDVESDKLIEKLREQLALSADYRLSAGYEHQAKSEEDQANRMRTLAFRWGFAAAVVAALSLALTFLGAARNWEISQLAVLPSKIAVVSAFAALAGYSGSQSSRHRNAARQLRTTQLELANLGSYLEPMPTERQAQMREDLLRSFFGKTVVVHPDDSPVAARLARPGAQGLEASD